MDCSACRSVILPDENYLCCSLGTCDKTYHALCTGLNNVNVDDTTWICPECRCTTKKCGDNTLTPVGSSKKVRNPCVPYRAELPVLPSTTSHLSGTICHACSDIIDKNDLHLICNTKACHNSLHLSCIQKGNTPYKDITSWICMECACKIEIINDVSLACSQNEIRDPNVTLRKKQSSATVLHEDQHLPTGELTSEIRYLRQEVLSLSEQLCQAMSCITSYHDKLELFSNQITTLDEKLKYYEDKQADICNSPVTETDSPVSTITTTKTAARKKSKKSKLTRQTKSLYGSESTPGSVTEQNHKSQHTLPQTLILQTPLNQTSPVLPPAVPSVTPPAPSSVQLRPDFCSARDTPPVLHQEPVITPKKVWGTQPKKSSNHRWVSGTAGPDITSLKAAEERKYLHLWNMESTADDVRSYLNQLCPSGSCTVDELKPKGHYRSYKIGIPVDYFETCFSINVWPINAKIQPWIPYRKRNGAAFRSPDTSHSQAQHFFRS
ncbi:hypothetical protein PYW08_008655 [Mythimna loreyi]|uniref:Uncharacterized protein n=1 Tax=Mythimna loreyi TaxID=667449 RepID=A0ACC2QE18_9NEOP|nr:hypothetical protein PYW08_008655 [Mythimna loreyi]